MTCPNCKETMKSLFYENQHILHCSNCGASFFEENSINRIAFESAKRLHQDRYTNRAASEKKLCPRDFTLLVAVSNTESVPQNATLFVCPICSGVFAMPEDLLNFKRAQGAKIDYYKVWQKPFLNLKAVLVLFLITILSATVYLTLRQRQVTQLQARDVVKTVLVTRSGRYLFISFKTASPLRSQIVFTDVETGEQIVKTVSAEPKTLHLLTTTDLDAEQTYTYHINLFNNRGSKTETDEVPLQIKK